MSQHFDVGGNNEGDESFPQQKDPNSQLLDQESNMQKRNENPDEVNMNPQNLGPLLPTPPSTYPVIRGKTNIFYKTRLCIKFGNGNCPNGERCTFAHGDSDLRLPPDNWQELVKDNRGGGNYWNDDQKIIQRMRICKKFVSGEECPYGERCTFLHESPAKFRAGAALDLRRARETSVINIPIMADYENLAEGSGSGGGGGSGSGSGHPLKGNEHKVQVRTVSNDPNVSMKEIYRKSRLCIRWEATGQCLYGDNCYFAHGLAEVQTPDLHRESDVDVHGPTVAASSHPNPMTGAPPTTAVTAVPTPAARGQLRGFAKLANRKIKGIYGDWIDDEDNE